MASYPRTTDEAITLIARAAANRAGVEKEIERCALALGTSVAALRATYYRHRPERLRATHARCKLTAQQSDTLARVLQAFSGANLGRRPGHLIEICQQLFNVKVASSWVTNYLKSYSEELKIRHSKALSSSRSNSTAREEVEEFILR